MYSVGLCQLCRHHGLISSAGEKRKPIDYYQKKSYLEFDKIQNKFLQRKVGVIPIINHLPEIGRMCWAWIRFIICWQCKPYL